MDVKKSGALKIFLKNHNHKRKDIFKKEGSNIKKKNQIYLSFKSENPTKNSWIKGGE